LREPHAKFSLRDVFRGVFVTPASWCSVAHIAASVSPGDNFVARARAKGF
jgi:hypothetical protein